MKRVDFYELSRAVQDRFVAATKGRGEPAPLASISYRAKSPFVWIPLSLASAAALVVFVRRGYGDLGSALAIHPAWAPFVGAALAALSIFGVLASLAAWRRVAGLPFRPGIYLYPMSVIDARDRFLRVHGTAKIEAVEEAGRAVRVRFPDEAFSFPATEGLAARVREAQEKARDERTTSNPTAMFALDALHEPRFSSPLAPTQSLVPDVPFWTKLTLPLAVAFGAAIAFPLWSWRNRASDEAIYAIAKGRDDVDGWNLYLAHGRAHRDEVAGVSLPRAELKIAAAKGSVEAIQAYVAAHPQSQIQSEIDADLRAAMLADLEIAKAPGTLAALRDFVSRHPDHHLDPELAAAAHGVFAKALDAYRAKAGSDPNAIGFFTRLFALAEKRWSTNAQPTNVVIRFRRHPSKNLLQADKIVQKNPEFLGAQSWPSRYFDDAHQDAREATAVKVLLDRLSAAFSPEILTFSAGPIVDDATAGDVPPSDAPVVVIGHHEEWWTAYASQRDPRGIWMAIKTAFDVVFALPGDASPLRDKREIARPIPVKLLKDTKTDVEEKVYDTMGDECFAQFDDQWLATILHP